MNFQNIFREITARVPLFVDIGNIPFSLAHNPVTEKLLVRAVRDRVRQRRLVFVISPGRGGSGFLARLLDTADNAVAFHEPRPRMTGRYLRLATEMPLHETARTRAVKLVGINLKLLTIPANSVYVETSHMFIKTFFDVAMDYYSSVDVIWLRRDLRRVLKSFIELRYMSEGNPRSWLWFPNPWASCNDVAPIAAADQLDIYDQCIAYLVNIEARALQFRSRYPHATHEVSLRSLNNQESAQHLFEQLRLEWSTETDQVLRDVVNDRTWRKNGFGVDVSLEYCGERIRKYIEVARRQGSWRSQLGAELESSVAAGLAP